MKTSKKKIIQYIKTMIENDNKRILSKNAFARGVNQGRYDMAMEIILFIQGRHETTNI